MAIDLVATPGGRHTYHYSPLLMTPLAIESNTIRGYDDSVVISRPVPLSLIHVVGQEMESSGWWLSWLERGPMHQQVVGSVPGQGTYLGWVLSLGQGIYRQQLVNVSLIFSLSLTINKIIASGEDLKEREMAKRSAKTPYLRGGSTRLLACPLSLWHGPAHTKDGSGSEGSGWTLAGISNSPHSGRQQVR